VASEFDQSVTGAVLFVPVTDIGFREAEVPEFTTMSPVAFTSTPVPLVAEVVAPPFSVIVPP
jgi:hypothetical protein